MTRDPAAAREAFSDAGAAFAALVAQLRPHVWTRPALGHWDVRALTGHTHRALVTLAAYLGEPADEERCTSTAQYYALAAAATGPAEVAARGVAAGKELGPDPAAAVRASLERAGEALAGVPSDQDPLIRTVVGGTRLSAYVPTRTFELVVHGIDLAEACETRLPAPEHVLADAVRTAGELAAARGTAPAALLALTGRRALPPGFTVLG